MKRIKTAGSILAVALMIVTGCGGGRPSADGMITVDVTESYPERELILQDFMDVEYVPLETADEYLCQGLVMAMGRELMMVRNFMNDGTIYVFDRRGNGLRRINRRGSGAEEYMNVDEMVLDEEAGEMFVHDRQLRKIQVYDLYGGYKRSIRCQDDISYRNLTGFDRENLICSGAKMNSSVRDGVYTADTKKPDVPAFVIISRQDGSIIRGVDIDYDEMVSTDVITAFGNGGIAISYTKYCSIMPEHGNWILADPSSDTIFRLLPDCSLTPLAARMPPIQSMQSKIFLFPIMTADRYFFMDGVKKEYNFDTREGFPRTHLMYDRQEKSIYKCSVRNDDWSKEIHAGTANPVINNEIALCISIEAWELVEAFENGELKGRLKEIAATLDEESNPVLMLVKHRPQ